MSYSLLSATLTDAYSALTEGDFVWILVGICPVFFMQAHIPIIPTIPIIESVLSALNQTNASFFFYYADGGKIGCHFYRAGHGTVHADV